MWVVGRGFGRCCGCVRAGLCGRYWRRNWINCSGTGRWIGGAPTNGIAKGWTRRAEYSRATR